MVADASGVGNQLWIGARNDRYQVNPRGRRTGFGPSETVEYGYRSSNLSGGRSAVPTSVLPRQDGFVWSAGMAACGLEDRIRGLKAPDHPPVRRGEGRVRSGGLVHPHEITFADG